MKNLLISIILLSAFICNHAYASQIKKLMASSASNDDNYGLSVSVSGDYAIIGSFGDDSLANASGAAYIYYRNQGGSNNWGLVKILKASDAGSNDRFGVSVSISGDNAIVGAWAEGSGGYGAGAAYVFSKDEGGIDNWGEVKKLLASNAGSFDSFGVSVSISGNYAIVGALYEDTGGNDAGAAYVFKKDQGGIDNWGEVKKLVASNAGAGDWFGYNVSISGDNAIVGAFNEDTGGIDAGAAYVFNKDEGSTDNWGEVKKLVASNAGDGDWFGVSVAISNNYAVIGANGEDTDGSDAGAGYIFNKDEGGIDNWGEVKKLVAGDGQADDWFGVSVAISNNYAVIGAYGEDTGGIEAGAAYMFSKDEGGADNWGEVKKLVAGDAQPGDWFGYSVSVTGGVVNSLIGAYGEDTGGSDAGAAYMFQLFPSIPTLPQWAGIIFGLSLAFVAVWQIRRFFA